MVVFTVFLGLLIFYPSPVFATELFTVEPDAPPLFVELSIFSDPPEDPPEDPSIFKFVGFPSLSLVTVD